MNTITEQIKSCADAKNAAFAAKLIPNIPAETVLGCRTPDLRKLAAALGTESGAVQAFLHTLPHTFFDENQLHAFLLCRIRSFPDCLAGVKAFLPYIDNWATCDQLSPPAFRRNAELLLPDIQEWLGSAHIYTVRFGIGMLMQHFLDARFRPEYPKWVAAVQSEEYYIQMEQAWYFATALAKQPDAALPYLTERRLHPTVHQKTIRKCIESRRIPDETKTFLRTMK